MFAMLGWLMCIIVLIIFTLVWFFASMWEWYAGSTSRITLSFVITICLAISAAASYGLYTYSPLEIHLKSDQGVNPCSTSDSCG